jgi:hypothetical protein
VEVLAMDFAAVLDAFERTESYPDMTDSAAVEQVAQRYGLNVNAADTAENHKADYQLLVQRSTDWQFVRQLARRNGYVCYFESDGQPVLHFKPRDLEGTPQADLTVLQAGANLQWLDVQWLTTGPVRWTGQAIDPIRKRVVRGEAATTLEPLGKDGLADSIEDALKALKAEGSAWLLRGPRPTADGIAAHSSGATDEARFVIEARGEVDPRLYRGLLRARRTALIKGAGSLLSGTYYVRNVRTTVDEGQLSQTFIAERNALGQTGQEDFGQSAEEAPPQ